mmetsp:Transcript_59064/g.116989  ORF Transcript_59064/g.116989 Transcript_59064/m.116989 type:complete len:279 (-) Transcript_59064:453-1289(-)
MRRKACFARVRSCPRESSSRSAWASLSCLLSISRHEVGRMAAGSLATSRMNFAPRSQFGKITLWCSTASGSGRTRTTADVTMPKQPSLPSTSPLRSMPDEVRLKAAAPTEPLLPWLCHTIPPVVASLTSSSISSMFPYLARFMPLARVAIHPPSVESSMESGSMPMVTPCFLSASFNAEPVIPACTCANPSSLFTERTLESPRMSMATKGRLSTVFSGQAVAEVTLVRPPTGTTANLTLPLSAARRTARTSSSVSGRTTASGMRRVSRIRRRQISASA